MPDDDDRDEAGVDLLLALPVFLNSLAEAIEAADPDQAFHLTAAHDWIVDLADRIVGLREAMEPTIGEYAQVLQGASAIVRAEIDARKAPLKPGYQRALVADLAKSASIRSGFLVPKLDGDWPFSAEELDALAFTLGKSWIIRLA